MKADKNRPALILSVDGLNKFAQDVCVVPVTTRQHANFSMRVLIKAGDGGVREDCWAKCDQVMTLPKILVQYPAKGSLTSQALRKIEEQVKIALGLLQEDDRSR